MIPRKCLIILPLIILPATLRSELIDNIRPLPLTPIEERALVADKLFDLPYQFTPYNTQRPRQPKRVGIFADRKVYLADDPVGQFLVYFIGQDYKSEGVKLGIEVARGDKVVGRKEIAPVTQPKQSFLVNVGELPAGKYRVRARIVGGNQYRTIPGCEFEKSGEKRSEVAFPKDGIPLIVHASAHSPGMPWPITTGVPLPRGMTESSEQFALLENGKPVTAQFTARATWTPTGQVRWLGLDFVANQDKGKPREYRVVRKPKTDPAAPTLLVQETPETIAVDTGKRRFTVDRKRFAGIARVGGAYLVDDKGERFDAIHDQEVWVAVEEKGPVRATIAATGWYTSAKTKGKLCRFQTRITAHAGQPYIDVNHVTILTYDTRNRKLADVGFDLKADGLSRWTFGVDGKPVTGDGTAWLHQDRWDHLRVFQNDKPLAEGKRADGWMSVATKTGSVSVLARNFWQLYPKEFEVGRDTITLHFWPKHGHVAFTDEEELTRRNIHKIFYAHQGPLLDLQLPRKYYDAMKKVHAMIERQDENALQANGQGLAIGNDFRICFQEETGTAEIGRHAAVFQNPPHAIADPAWISKTEVEGRFAPEDRKRFPNVEKVLVDGFHGSHVSSILGSDAYGMWIWPDTHNNWEPALKIPEWHRFWLNTHYQGGWVNWLMYLRSGDPRLYRWAMDNTDHLINVSTVNHDNPAEPIIGHMAGAMYHTKGFLPWGSQTARVSKGDDYVEVGAHFINPDAFIIRWLLLGDRRAKAMMEEWGGRALGRAALPPERSREACVTLGELISYYQATWDPQAILYIHDLADELMSRPVAEIPAAGGHGFFHQQWVRRYWELTRDPRLVAWVLEYADANKGTTGFSHLDALLAQWTGKREYLTQNMARTSTLWQGLYFNPDDPLNGLGLGCVARSWVSQSLAYFAGALLDADITSLPTDESNAEPAAATLAIAKTNNFCPAGWFLYKAGSGYGYLEPKGAEPSVTLTFSPVLSQFGYGPALNGNGYPAYIRVEDAAGQVLFETTILNGSLRPTATIALDARKQKSPWKLHANGSRFGLFWDGPADSLVIAPTPDEAKAEPSARKSETSRQAGGIKR